VGGSEGVLGGIRLYSVSEMAQVELSSGRVLAPARWCFGKPSGSTIQAVKPVCGPRWAGGLTGHELNLVHFSAQR